MSDYTPPFCTVCKRFLRSRSFSDGALVGHDKYCDSLGAKNERQVDGPQVKITRTGASVVPGSEVTQRTTRPIERIDEVLDEIGRIWRMYPDMRLTQLLWNLRDVVPGADREAHIRTATRFYNMEEDALMTRLRERYGVPE